MCRVRGGYPWRDRDFPRQRVLYPPRIAEVDFDMDRFAMRADNVLVGKAEDGHRS